jgi:hypothetical protein
MSKTYEIGPRQNFIPLSTGEYTMTLKSVEEHVEEQDSQYSKKGDVRLEWTWLIELPGEEEPAVRKTRTPIPQSFNEKSGMVKILVALKLVDAAKAIAEGCKIDPERGVGRRCLGTIVKKLKEGKSDEWTDSITAYAPIPSSPAPLSGVPLGGSTASPAAQGVPADARVASEALRHRLDKLAAFAGTSAVDKAATEASAATVAAHIRSLGNMAMTEVAQRNLEETMETASVMGLQVAETVPFVGTLKDGLLLCERIQAQVDAL